MTWSTVEQHWDYQNHTDHEVWRPGKKISFHYPTSSGLRERFSQRSSTTVYIVEVFLTWHNWRWSNIEITKTTLITKFEDLGKRSVSIILPRLDFVGSSVNVSRRLFTLTEFFWHDMVNGGATLRLPEPHWSRSLKTWEEDQFSLSYLVWTP